MKSAMKTRYYQFLEHARQEGLCSAIKLTIYKCEEILPVEKDLNEIKKVKCSFDESRYQIVELHQDNRASFPFTYAYKSRQQKVDGYLDNGFRAFTIIRDSEVVGDIWFATRDKARLDYIHPRLKWFGIKLAQDEVFLFDLFVVPDERGKSITAYFFTKALETLRDRGYKKAYGDYVANNIPAMWLHRTLGYRERPGVVLKRFFLFESAAPLVTRAVSHCDVNRLNWKR
jgi:GNAT superfamily N-acetyltransferase